MTDLGQLYQLRSGNWIMLGDVRGIDLLTDEPRVLVRACISAVSASGNVPFETSYPTAHGFVNHHIERFATIEDAAAYRDELAALVNAARAVR